MKRRLMNFGFSLHRFYLRVRKPVTLGSRALVVQGKDVLLVRLTYYRGWFLPGGGVDKGESFHAAVERELMEECGIEARKTRLFGLYLNTRRGQTDHVAIYVVDQFAGTPGIQDVQEIAEVKFFSKHQLPKDLHPGHRRRIEEYFGERSQEAVW